MKTRNLLLAVAGSSLLINFPSFAQQNGKPTAPAAAPKAAAPAAVPKVAPAAPAAPTIPITPNGPAGVAAEVNGEKIPLGDLNRMVESVKESDPAFKADTPAVKKALLEIRGQMLDEMISTKVLAQEAKRRKITVPAKDVDEAIVQLKGGFKTDAEFQSWLKDDGKTTDDLKRVIADELSIRELTLQIAADVTVSNEDIASYYRANIETFTLPEAIKARHILLALNPNSPKEEKERVKKRAVALIAQLNGNADFATMAKNNSDDPITKDRGGAMQVFARGQITLPLEKAAFAAQVGKIVGPIESGIGIHILKVDEKLPAQVMPLATVQKDPRLRAILLKQKVQQKIDDSTNKLKATASIKKYV